MGLPNIGPLELIIILAIALLIVGPGRLPEMGNAIGRTIREFRKASSDVSDATSIDAVAAPAPSASTTAPAASAQTTMPGPVPDEPVTTAAQEPPSTGTAPEADRDASHDRNDA